MDAVIAAPGDFENISFDKKIRVCCKGNVNLSINSVPTVTYSGGATPTITDTQIPTIKNRQHFYKPFILGLNNGRR